MKCAPLLALLALTALPAAAEDKEFRFFRQRLEVEYGARRLYIPLFGIARFFARPLGAHGLELAVWEDMGRTHRDIPPGFDQEFAARGWKPMIRVHSPRKGEMVRIYARPEGKYMRLMLFTVDDDTVMVHVKVDPHRVSRMLGEPRFAASRIMK
jgi:hypothetical protein